MHSKVNKQGCLFIREVKVCKLFSNIVCESLAFQSIYKIKNAFFEKDKPCLTHL